MERSFQRPSVPTARRFKRQGVRGRVEPLERRWMLSVISVYATDAYATEGESTGTLVFSRDGSLTQSLTLNYAVSGSATPGIDFQSIGGAITIPAGLASTSLAIVPIADNIAEPTEFVTVTLGAVAGYAIDLGSATVTIHDAFDGAAVDALVPLSETFSLHSLPGAHHTIYLDFDGGIVQDPSWNNGSIIHVNPFSMDGTSAFSDNELAVIQRAWDVVAEDYRPFAVDVTTELPDIEKLRKVGTGDKEWGVHVMIGDPVEYNTGATGRAMTGSFNASYDAVVWVDLSDPGFTVQNARTIGGIASHEVGHSLGLDHDRGSPGGEYYEGQGTGETDWSPIMGNIFPSVYTTWSNGGYPTATNFEDDLTIIGTQNGFTWRPDDHADSAAQATPLASLGPNHWIGEGVIETRTDYDMFSFAWNGGSTRIAITPTSVSPNVDLRAELYDSSQNLIAVSDVTDQLSASFEQSLAAGTYYVRVTGTGNRTWTTGGYDDYSSLGAYKVEIGGFGNLATFIPSGSTNSSTPLAGVSQFQGVVIGGLTQHATSGSTNTDAWPIGWDAPASQDLNEYVTFSLTPAANTQLDFQKLSVNLKSWVSGSSNVAIRSSRDNFAANIDGTRILAGNAGSDFTFNVASVADSTTTIEFRLYVWGSGFGFRDLHSLNLSGRTLSTGSPSNTAPVASNDTSTTNEDSSIAINVLANDSDLEGDVLTPSVVTQPSHGAVTINANRTITYSPAANFNGTDSFTYRVSDGALSSNTATVTITVIPVNDAPVAAADAATTGKNVAVGINVLANDTDVDGDPLTPSIVASPLHGSVSVNSNGTITYSPATDYLGSDSFTYQVSDGLLASNIVTVSLIVAVVNSAPVAVNDSANTLEDTSVPIDVLTNDSDPDGQSLTPSIYSQPAHGAVVVNANGTVTYTPAANYHGVDSFTYRVSDGLLYSNVATVSLVVDSVNDAPVAAADSTTTPKNVSVVINVLANDSDVDGDVLTPMIGASPSHGTVTVNANGTITYTPVTNYLGSDSFAYQVSDGLLTSNTVSVDLTVVAVNSAPVAVNDSANTDEDTAVTIDALANDSDPDGQSLTGSIVSQPTHGAVVINVSGTMTYTPFANYHGTDSFTYRVSDGSLFSNIATVSIGIASINDAPIAAADSASTGKNVAVAINVLANDGDVDGDLLTPTIVTSPAHGTATINANGTIVYTPANAFVGSDVFTYRVSDGSLFSNSATVSVTVNDVLSVLARFDPVGSQGNANLSGSTDLVGATVGALSRVGATYGTNTDDWPVYWYGSTTVDTTQYLTFTVTPTASDAASFNRLTVSFQEWVTGTSNVAVRTSLDGFAANVGGVQLLTDTGSADVTFDLTSLPLAVGTTTFRIYVFDTVDGTAGWRDIRSSLWNNGKGVLLEGTTAPSPAPVATNDSATTNEDTPIAINVLSNDRDPASLLLTPSIVTQPAHGTVAVNPDGTINYAPSANYNGPDSFTYRVSNGSFSSNNATVNIGVTSVNDAPVAVGDLATTNKNVAVTINVLANDSDVDGDVLTPGIVTQPLHGTAAVNGNGTIVYTPSTGFVGSDLFSYQVSDGFLTSNTVTVGLTVNQVVSVIARFDPVGSQGSANLQGSTSLIGATIGNLTRVGASYGTNTDDWPVYWYASTTVDATQYLAFTVTTAPTDLARFTKLSVSFQEWVTGTSNVALRTSLDGFAGNVGGVQLLTDTGSADVTFDLASLPLAGGTTAFRIYVFDNVDATAGWRDIRSSLWNNGKGVLLEGLTVPNSTPVAGNDTAPTDEDTAAVITVLANDSDPDGTLLTPSIVTQPGHGTVVLNSNGTLTYTPAANYFGSDSFTYRVSDGGLLSNIATVSLAVAPVNDAPVTINDSYSTNFQTVLNTVVPGVLANDSDIEGSPLTATLVTGPSHGSVTLNTDGSFQYTPVIGYYGTDSFTYSASDGSLSTQAIATITVKPPIDDHSNFPNSTATAITMSLGNRGHGSSAGVFEIVGDRDVFQVSLAKGTLTIALNGINNLDTYLRVYNSAGTQIAYDDDSGPGTSSALTISVAAGTYYVSAGSYADSFTGSFTLDIDHKAQVTAAFQQGVAGYTGTSDTYMSGSYPSTSFATTTINQIDYTSSSLQEQSLLQFKNLFGSGTGQIPFGSEIISATLTMYITNGGNRVNVHRMLKSWTDTVTWNGMVSGIQANGIEAATTPDAQTPLSTPVGWLNIDVKTSIVSWLANPTLNFGWAFLPTGTDGVDFYSANNSSYWVPRLSVDYFVPNGDLHANTPSAAATSLAVTNNHASIFGTLDSTGDRDVFQFSLTQTRTVTINLSAYGSNSTLDTYLRLYNSVGSLLSENNDNGHGTDSTITLTLGPGTYFVSVAASLDLSVGDYWLDLFL